MTKEEILNWRAEFPLLERKIHVANCSQSPQSKRVRTAIHTYLDSWQESGMDWDAWLVEVDRAKAEFARLIQASPGEIAISTSASAAAASIASALQRHGSRMKIVTTDAEFPTVALVWLAQRKHGFQVDYIPVRDGRVWLDDYEKQVDESTLITSSTHVYYQNGFKQDLPQIAKIAHQKGALFFVDAYQSLGTCLVDVKQMDIDILISGNLKYLLGIPGIAFLYVKKELAEKLQPTVTGWFGQENPFAFDNRNLTYANDSRRFDTGTPPLIAAFAASAGMQIINEIGVKNIEERINLLSEYALERIEELRLEYVGPQNLLEKGATTAIRVADPHKVEVLLKEKNIIASARGDVIRIAPHFFTTEEDLDKVFRELKGILD